MKHQHRDTVDAHVERICNQGCRQVRERIERMEGGDWGLDLEGLARVERRAVLQELKSIMAVYGPVCRTDVAEPVTQDTVKTPRQLL